MSFLIGIVVGIGVTMLFEYILTSNPHLKKNYWDNPKGIFGYHVHHSSYGLLVLVVGSILLVLQSGPFLFCFGLGLGIIIMHTITDKRLVFVEKL